LENSILQPVFSNLKKSNLLLKSLITGWKSKQVENIVRQYCYAYSFYCYAYSCRSSLGAQYLKTWQTMLRRIM